MATKAETLDELARGEGCLGRAADDEPVFVLRAKDPAAALIVRIWYQFARQLALHEEDKIDEALTISEAMEAWRNAHCEPYRWGHD